MQLAENIEMKQIEWLWDGWLAKGKLHLLAGIPGTGKTSIATAIAATVSSGGILPDGSHCKQGYVYIFTAEDDLGSILKPRLAAAGADMSHTVLDDSITRITLQAEMLRKRLEQIPEALHPALVIIDPITSVVRGTSNPDVRASLQTWVRLADDYGFAILGITHTAKGAKNKAAVHRMIGAQSYGSVSRIVWMVEKLESGSLSLFRAKSNYGPTDGGYEYGIESAHVADQFATSKVSWKGWFEDSSDFIESPSVLDDAISFLRDALSSGPVLATAIQRIAATNFITTATLRRAKEQLRVESRKVTEGWIWCLPA